MLKIEDITGGYPVYNLIKKRCEGGESLVCVTDRHRQGVDAVIDSLNRCFAGIAVFKKAPEAATSQGE